jgi:cyclopropane fatty-acyl-phospholipid synthase-like methyltransferase
MPNFLFEQFFAKRIADILTQKGCFLFNTMILNHKDQNRNKEYVTLIENQIFKIDKISNIENFNELIIGYKI